jgi:hypothetical protein
VGSDFAYYKSADARPGAIPDSVNPYSLFTEEELKSYHQMYINRYGEEEKKKPYNTNGAATMRHTTALYLEDGKTAIRTQAATEDVFLSDFSTLLVGAIKKFNGNQKEAELHVKAFCSQAVDLCCKLRGYKADVDEERILIAGDRLLTSAPLLTVNEQGKLA